MPARRPAPVTTATRPSSGRGSPRVATPASSHDQSGSAEPVVIHSVRAEVPDRIHTSVPDGQHEKPVAVPAEMEIAREAAARKELLALEPSCTPCAHADV